MRSLALLATWVFLIALVHGCKQDAKSDSKGAATPKPGADMSRMSSRARPARPRPAERARPVPSSGCAKLFAVASGKHPFRIGSCIEGAFEERDHDFDTKSCNGLENAWVLGNANAALWLKCQKEDKFDDADCNAVLKQCF